MQSIYLQLSQCHHTPVIYVVRCLPILGMDMLTKIAFISQRVSLSSAQPCCDMKHLGAGKYDKDKFSQGPRSALFRQILPGAQPLLHVMQEVAENRNKTVPQVALMPFTFAARV